jgi:hypothetical protein
LHRPVGVGEEGAPNRREIEFVPCKPVEKFVNIRYFGNASAQGRNEIAAAA